MAETLARGAHSSAAGDIHSRAASFRRALVAGNPAPMTVRRHTDAVAR